ncbi:hypothetical protein C8J56DRAFT_215014 [Mycena floridula]|nr:hypothetical protein C8J56DRAFT_215014 [Mycena floridula]
MTVYRTSKRKTRTTCFQLRDSLGESRDVQKRPAWKKSQLSPRLTRPPQRPLSFSSMTQVLSYPYQHVAIMDIAGPLLSSLTPMRRTAPIRGLETRTGSSSRANVPAQLCLDSSNLVATRRDPVKIPGTSSHRPIVRSPPAALYQFVSGPSSSIGLSPTRDEPIRGHLHSSVAPIGSERSRTISAAQFSELCGNSPSSERDTTFVNYQSFRRCLLESRQKNPHAPLMMSRFNPLREKYAPSRFWSTQMRPGRRWNFFTEVIQVRCREECDQRLGERYLRDGSKHCQHCRADTLRKRLLFTLYQKSLVPAVQEESESQVIDIVMQGSLTDEIWSSPANQDMRDVRNFYSDVIMPDSPELHDLDDFGEDDDESQYCVLQSQSAWEDDAMMSIDE